MYNMEWFLQLWIFFALFGFLINTVMMYFEKEEIVDNISNKDFAMYSCVFIVCLLLGPVSVILAIYDLSKFIKIAIINTRKRM